MFPPWEVRSEGLVQVGGTVEAKARGAGTRWKDTGWIESMFHRSMEENMMVRRVR